MKRLSIAAAVAAATAVIALPSGASAGPVDDLVGHVQNTVNQTLNNVNGLLSGGNGGGGSAPAPAPAGSPTPQAEGGSTEPELDGTGPHAQGEGIDLTTDAPVLDTVVGDVVVGQSRGEQDEDGNYHGNVTVLSISGLGIDLSFPSEAGEEPNTGPLGPLNDGLAGLCDTSDICLEVLAVNSHTTDSGSENSFEAVDLGLPANLLAVGAIQSEGNISDDGSCQNADSSSSVAEGDVVGVVGATVIESESHSEACNDGSEEPPTADSDVADLTALDFNIGDLVETGVVGCESGDTVDDPFYVGAAVVGQALARVLEGVCNGDDTNGSQADSPYNVRKGLGADILTLLEDELGFNLNLDVSTSESLARAPGEEGPECPDPTNPDCPPIDECPDPTNPDCPPIDECPDPSNTACPAPAPECPDPANPDCPPADGEGPGGPSADAPDDDLPFTGADMGTLGAIGIGIMAIGLALMALLDRRRQTLRS